ncbi:MAG: 50S ribosomal protein L30 [Thermosphaera sp.]
MAGELYAVLRLRGLADTPPDVEHTLKLLRLHKKYHLVLYPSDLPGLKKMLDVVKDWATWGEISRETLVELLRKRGRTVGGRKLTDEYVNEKLKDLGVTGGIEGLANALLEGRVRLHEIDHLIKPVFRMHPPRGGFKKSIKKSLGSGGELGYRGRAINELIMKMI